MKSSLFLTLLTSVFVMASPFQMCASTTSTTDPQLNMVQEKSLMRYARNVYSQRGEDGILQEILSRLKIKHGFFVEFGAWDGKWLSNSKLLVDQGWSGIFIEADPKGFKELAKNYKDIQNILCLHQFVTYSENDLRGKTIDAILDKYFPNQEIDFMSIDIDGADHLILEGLKCKPKILCVEGGFSWNPLFTTRVPDKIAFKNLQQPLAVMIEIGKKNGYEPVCFTQNTFFIRKDLYAPFEEISNDAFSLWKDGWYSLPDDTQKWLLNFRATNSQIRKIEGPEFLNLNL